MKTKLLGVIAAGLLVLAGSLTSCNRDENGTGRLQVRIMDAPSPYDFDAIYLDVVRVEAHVDADGGEGEWILLGTAAGVYDMLTLVNGTDVLLANEEIPAGHISQIRLVLGPGNTIVVDGISHPLTIPSGEESGLKINVHEYVGDGTQLTLMLDFDAAHSIVVNASGYKLKPVLRGIVLEHSGSIHGTTTVVAGGSVAVIADMNAGTTYATYTNRATGEFLLRGLPPGTYTVKVYYPDSDRAVVYENIVVSANTVAELN
jgi:hypothetical protein